MKTITTLKIDITPVHIGFLLVLIIGTVYMLTSPASNENRNTDAASVLNKFGASIRGKLTDTQKKEISKLANIPIPIAGLIDNQTYLATGIGASTDDEKKIIILNTLTGKPARPCKPTDKNKTCGHEVYNPSDDLQNILNLTDPIQGYILKQSEDTPTEAKFYVTVTAVYPGSKCTTVYSNKKKYVFCF